jgi:hypothetical protein
VLALITVLLLAVLAALEVAMGRLVPHQLAVLELLVAA